MPGNPLVSVVIPTRNSEETIEGCVNSAKSQTYTNVEVTVVDNYSADDTRRIAAGLGCSVYLEGPERSAQRNFGASKSHGEYILFLDSDMIAPKRLVQHCIDTLDNERAQTVLIPYISKGKGYWTKCRCLESLFYQTEEFSMARFFRREAFLSSGGFDVTLNAAEDTELYLHLVNLGFKTALSKIKIVHWEKEVGLHDLIRKDVWAMPYVSKYLEKRSKYKTKPSGSRFPLLYIRKVHLLKSHAKYIPGLVLLKAVDYLAVLISLIG